MIPHDIIMNLIQKKIVCFKTNLLISRALSAGYQDPDSGGIITTKIGTPQGSVLSPLLANIVLNELDQYMDQFKQKFDVGKKRARNRAYDSLSSQIQNAQKVQNPDPKRIKALVLERRKLHSELPIDPNFKRLMYLRYADDFIVLVAGSHHDATLIKNRIKDVLYKKCGLNLNTDKTVISRTRDGFEFLGAFCVNPNTSNFLRPSK